MQKRKSTQLEIRNLQSQHLGPQSFLHAPLVVSDREWVTPRQKPPTATVRAKLYYPGRFSAPTTAPFLLRTSTSDHCRLRNHTPDPLPRVLRNDPHRPKQASRQSPLPAWAPQALSPSIQWRVVAFRKTPVSTYSRDGYNWDTVQAGNNSIFPGVIKCNDPLCTSTTPGTTPVPKFNLYSVSPDFRTPYFYNYNLQVEKGFGNAVVWQIGYVGSGGRKLNIVSNINQNGAFPTFGNILQLNTIGTSNYNALQTIFRTRAWRGFSSQFAYTWAHSLDEISEYRGAIADDAFNLKRDYGNSDYDTRHLFTVAFTYDVPKAPWATSGFTKRVFNDWQISSVMNWHRGQPSDEGRLGLSVIGNPFAGVSHKFDPSFGTQWWNPAAFCSPGGTACPGSADNLSRNKFTAPGYGDVDLSFIKNIPITERVRIQLRSDFFNLFNRINLASGVGSVGSVCAANPVTGVCTANSGFGQVSDTIGDFNGAPAIGPGESRNIQLVAKIIF